VNDASDAELMAAWLSASRASASATAWWGTMCSMFGHSFWPAAQAGFSVDPWCPSRLPDRGESAAAGDGLSRICAFLLYVPRGWIGSETWTVTTAVMPGVFDLRSWDTFAGRSAKVRRRLRTRHPVGRVRS